MSSPISSLLLAVAVIGGVGACTTPSARHSSQLSPLSRGDAFMLLSPASAETAMGRMDAQLLNLLQTRTTAAANGRIWMVEYGYSVRPADIAMTSDGKGEALLPPRANALLACNDISHRVTVRILDKQTGALAYRGTAEILVCGEALTPDETIFTQLARSALSNLTVQ